MDELYSYNKYQGYCIFVEDHSCEEYTHFEGVAQYNGTTIFTSKSSVNGDIAENKLITLIDKKEEVL